MLSGILAAAMIARVAAQTTGVVVDVDATIRLTCISPLQFAITGNDLTQAFFGSASANPVRITNAGTVPAQAVGSKLVARPSGLNTALSSDPTRYILRSRGCLIEGNASFGQVFVTIALIGNSVLYGPGTSRITVRSVKGRMERFGGAYSSSFNFSAIYLLFLFQPLYLEYEIEVDLSNASRSGLHEAPTPGVFRVTVVRP